MPGQTNFTGYRNHFRMPSAESNGLGNFWYSFDHGMVHYVQIDTETDLGHGLTGPDEPGGSEGEDSGPFSNIRDAQLNWLQQDLASVDRSKTPWVVVGKYILIYGYCLATWMLIVRINSRPPPVVRQRHKQKQHHLRRLSQGLRAHLPQILGRPGPLWPRPRVRAQRADQLHQLRSERTQQPQRAVVHHERCCRTL